MKNLFLFLLSQISSFIFTDCTNPFLLQWLGFMLFKIESNHDGGADALDFLSFRINHPLGEVKTLCPDFRNGSLYGDVVRTVNLCKEVSFDVHNDNAISFPVNVRTHRSKILRFSQILEREINRIVHMAELIDIIKS